MEGLGLPQLAAPRADWEGFARLEAFEGSIRHFRANKNERRGSLGAARAPRTGQDEVHTKGGPRRRPGHG